MFVAAGDSGSGYSIANSLRFRSSASAYLSRTTGTPTNGLKWTLSAWIKRGELTTAHSLLGATNATTTTNASLVYSASGGSGSGDYLNLHFSGAGTRPFVSAAVYRDPSAHTHLVFVYDSANATAADRAILYVNGVRQTDTVAGVTLNQDCAINKASSTFTIGKGTSGYGTASDYFDGLLSEINFIDGYSLTSTTSNNSAVVTGISSTANLRVGYSVSGTGVPSGAKILTVDSSTQITMTANATASGTVSLGYCPQDPSFFGEYNADGVWVPKKYTGTYGNNGFWLPFSDGTSATTLGYDKSGNANNWTPSGISTDTGIYTKTGDISTASATITNTTNSGVSNGDLVISSNFPAGTKVSSTTASTIVCSANASQTTTGATIQFLKPSTAATYDWMTDTPTNNFSVGNSIDKESTFTFSDGNLKTSSSSGNVQGRATGGVSSGKWYWEFTGVSSTSSGGSAVGVSRSDVVVSSFTGTALTYLYHTGALKYDGSTSTSWGNTWTDNDVIGVALDLDNGAIYFSKNGTWQNSGDPTSGATKTGAAFTSGFSGYTWLPLFRHGTGGTCAVNFGQRPFAYTPPTGFKALCTANLPSVAITDPRKHFDIKTRTGTGASANITGYAFQPDLVWIKSRGRAVDHALFDRVRGVQKMLESNQTGAETTETTGLTAFNSDGYTIGALDQINGTTATNSFVDWAWKANGSGVTNTQPANGATISSVYSANDTNGFSIVTYTGTGSAGTIYHGCKVNGVAAAPKMVICKGRGNTGTGNAWPVYHEKSNASPASGGGLYLETTTAFLTDSTIWNNTVPTSSVFSIGTWNGINKIGIDYVAYCFAEVPGFSKFGSYVGTGAADGPFIFTGFRPRYVLVKRSDAAENWMIWDAACNTFNVSSTSLRPNISNAESTAVGSIDILSNGFKLRTDGTLNGNANGGTFIFAAFAEFPNGSNVAPAPAR